MSLLELRNISKSYGAGPTLVHALGAWVRTPCTDPRAL